MTHNKPQGSHVAPCPIGLKTCPFPLARPIVTTAKRYKWYSPFPSITFLWVIVQAPSDLSSEHRYPDHSRLDLTETAGTCFLLSERNKNEIRHGMMIQTRCVCVALKYGTCTGHMYGKTTHRPTNSENLAIPHFLPCSNLRAVTSSWWNTIVSKRWVPKLRLEKCCCRSTKAGYDLSRNLISTTSLKCSAPKSSHTVRIDLPPFPTTCPACHWPQWQSQHPFSEE